MAGRSGMQSLIFAALLLAAGAAGGAVGMRYWSAARARQAAAEPEPTPGAVRRVAARGRLEPAGGVINLAAPMPDILRRLAVQEGQEIRVGQELAVLASHDLRQLEIAAAKIQLAEAEERRARTLAHLKAQQKEADAKIRALEEQGPSDIRLQEAKIEALLQQFATAELLVTRMRQSGSFPKQEIDQHELARVQAEQELRGARAGLKKIKDTHAASLEAARAQRAAGEAGILRAEAEALTGTLVKGVELAEEKLKLTVIRSPIAGRVLKVLAREGEMVGAQPVFQVADPSAMIALAEVYETDVPRVREWFRGGKPVEAEIEARFLGGESVFRGTVERIGTLTAKNSIFTIDPRQDMDRRVVEVRIRLDDAHHAAASDFINMTVNVTILEPK